LTRNEYVRFFLRSSALGIAVGSIISIALGAVRLGLYELAVSLLILIAIGFWSRKDMADYVERMIQEALTDR
jgi:hypothetical protein